MTHIEFLQVFAAVFFANAFTAVFIYAFWRATRAEKNLSVKDGSVFFPLWLYVAMLVPLGLAFLGVSHL